MTVTRMLLMGAGAILCGIAVNGAAEMGRISPLATMGTLETIFDLVLATDVAILAFVGIKKMRARTMLSLFGFHILVLIYVVDRQSDIIPSIVFAMSTGLLIVYGAIAWPGKDRPFKPRQVKTPPQQ